MSVRFNLEFPDDYKTIVEELRLKTGLSTQKDVFENALALFGWAVREVSRRRVIASLDEAGGTYNEIHMPALMAISPVPAPIEPKKAERVEKTEKRPQTRADARLVMPHRG